MTTEIQRTDVDPYAFELAELKLWEEFQAGVLEARELPPPYRERRRNELDGAYRMARARAWRALHP